MIWSIFIGGKCQVRGTLTFGNCRVLLRLSISPAAAPWRVSLDVCGLYNSSIVFPRTFIILIIIMFLELTLCFRRSPPIPAAFFLVLLVQHPKKPLGIPIILLGRTSRDPWNCPIPPRADASRALLLRPPFWNHNPHPSHVSHYRNLQQSNLNTNPQWSLYKYGIWMSLVTNSTKTSCVITKSIEIKFYNQKT